MSGAAAISAAKNRRGNVAIPPSPAQTSIRTSQSSNPTASPNNKSELPKPSNPLQALQLHEIRLNRNDKTCTELENSIKLLSDVVSTIQQQQKQQQQQQQQPTQPKTDNNNTQLYQGLTQMNERLSNLEEMFSHLKEDIFRVQTFAMETNLSFLRYQSTDVVKPTVSVPNIVPNIVVEPNTIDAENISLHINESTAVVDDLTLGQIGDISQ